MTRSRVDLRLLICACSLMVPVFAAAAQLPQKPANLQVLPAHLTTDSVVALMRSMTGALGTRCVYCHAGKDTPNLDSIDFASDSRESKRKARAMLQLVAKINTDLDLALPGRGEQSLKVNCITCHRGSPRPLLLEDTLETTLTAVGMDSTIGLYRGLRQRTFGRFTWDFSERTLNVLAGRLVSRGQRMEARKALELNAELYPNSWNVAYLLANAHVSLGERDSAIAQYTKALELLKPIPHAIARRRLDSLLAARPR